MLEKVNEAMPDGIILNGNKLECRVLEGNLFSRTPDWDFHYFNPCQIILSHTPVSALEKDKKQTGACWQYVDP